MKKIILSLMLCAGLGCGYAQEKKDKAEKDESKEPKLTEAEVPAPVKSKFATLYPGVKAEKWVKEDGNYEVAFHNNKVEMTITVDAAGNLMETESEVNVSELPKAIAEYVAKNKGGKKIKEAAKIVDAKGNVTWEAEVDKMDLVFDKDGKFIKEVKD